MRSTRVLITRAGQTFVPSTLVRKSLVEPALNFLRYAPSTQGPVTEFFVDGVSRWRGSVSDQNIFRVINFLFNGNLTLPGPGGYVSLSWNNRGNLGSPVQLVSGNRYMSRWLSERPQATSCGAVLDSVKQAILQGANTPSWPWQGLVASGLPPAGFPANMGNFPFATPGFCPIWIDGVWTGATTPTMDSKQIPAIVPGFFNFDLFNATTGQQLVEGPTPPVGPSGPCNPADLTFDPVTGIFRCAGQVIITPTTPPQIPNQPPLPPVNIPPTQPPTQAPPKKEEKSVLPWVIGGGVVLLGGALLLARK